MNTDPNIEDYPRLVPPEVVYEGKAALKKPVVIPLYVKIASAAAAVALLAGLFWRQSVMPKQPLMAEMTAIKATGVVNTESPLLAQSDARFTLPKTQTRTKTRTETKTKPQPQTQTQTTKPNTVVRETLSPIAALNPQTATLLSKEDDPAYLALSGLKDYEPMALLNAAQDTEEDLSILRKGLLKLTDGQYDSFASMFGEGWRKAKTELAMAKEQTFSLPLQKIRDYDLELHHLEP